MQKTISVIDLCAIRRNAQKIRKILGGRRFYAVVKADAYGHGAEEVARYIEDIADGFCVAITEEGISLRVAGITKPVLVLTPPLDAFDVSRAAAYGLTVTVNSVETARLSKGVSCQIKVNTGMNRHGCGVDELSSVLGEIPQECLEGVYSHLYAPDADGDCARQRELFLKAAELVKSVKPVCAHLSASGGILRGEDYLFDGARCGILLYGYAPSGFVADVEPALKVYARRTQTTRFIGGGVGYKRADKDYGTLCAYRCGYADGFLRGVPLGVNELCMDAFISEENKDAICVMDNAEKYASQCGTISYEALTNVTRRSERIYLR